MMDERLEQAVAAWAATGEAQKYPELVALGLWQPSGDPDGAALTALGYNGPAVTEFIDLAQESRAADDAARAAEEKCFRASNSLAHAGEGGHEAMDAAWDLDWAWMHQQTALAKCNRARIAARAEVHTDRMLRLVERAEEGLAEAASSHVVRRGQDALQELKEAIRGLR